MKTNTIGEHGDLSATPGTRAWAVAVKREIDASLGDIQSQHEHLILMLGGMKEHAGYRVLASRDGQPFQSHEEFCITPQPHGLGYALSDIEAIINERIDSSSRNLCIRTGHGNNNCSVCGKWDEETQDDLVIYVEGTDDAVCWSCASLDAPELVKALEEMKPLQLTVNLVRHPVEQEQKSRTVEVIYKDAP